MIFAVNFIDYPSEFVWYLLMMRLGYALLALYDYPIASQISSISLTSADDFCLNELVFRWLAMVTF